MKGDGFSRKRTQQKYYLNANRNIELRECWLFLFLKRLWEKLSAKKFNRGRFSVPVNKHMVHTTTTTDTGFNKMAKHLLGNMFYDI